MHAQDNFTTDRVFMSVVGPFGSEKTGLFLSMLTFKTFYQQVQHNRLLLHGFPLRFQGSREKDDY